MEAYTPIEPFEVLSQRLGLPPEEIVKLDANENPYGPVPQVREALGSLPWPHIYPDPESRQLREALSGWTGVPVKNIVAGAGADELIDLIMRLVLDPGDTILNCPPTFGMYAFGASIQAARVVNVPRRLDFSLDLETIEQAAQKEQAKLLFLTSPNNPDGSQIPPEQVLRLLELPLLLVLDEAYVDFAKGRQSLQHAALEHHNLIVLRTFSKWAGLAGMRVGYGVFPDTLLPHLWKIKQPYNVSVAASTAAVVSLQYPDALEVNRQKLLDERDRLNKALQTVPFLQPYPSQANFILCKVLDRDARQLKFDLAARGILVRYFEKPGLKDKIRISVGKPEHTDRLISNLLEME
ncbi:MAG: histidinol-phosphate transaminase [Anaerolineales bacterium]|nr:histidinol-phosphate transaminase [Anaerolineales bacterium]